VKYLVFVILSLIVVLVVAGLCCKVFLGWTWKKYFEEIFGWLIDI